MAGETTNFDEYSTTAFKSFGLNIGVLDKTHEVTTGELELADVMKVGTVPSGSTYLYGFIATDDLDSNGTPALEFILGDDDDDNGLLVTGTNAGQAAGITTFNGAYITNKTTITAEKTIYLKVGTAAATAAAGTIRVVLFYYNA
jgi:hypothetical protein